MKRIGELAFAAWLAISLTVLGIVLSPLMLFGEKAARQAPKIWIQSSLFMLRVLTGISHRIEGDNKLPIGGALVAANHQSVWETMALYALLPSPVAILKEELLDIPMFGWWARATGNIAVDRKGAVKALRDMQRKSAEKIAAGNQVIIFPEGTRVKPGEKTKLKPGAAGIYAAIDAPCIPVSHDAGRFWHHPGIEKTPGQITLRIGNPIPQGLERKEFMAALTAELTRNRQDLIDAGTQNA